MRVNSLSSRAQPGVLGSAAARLNQTKLAYAPLVDPDYVREDWWDFGSGPDWHVWIHGKRLVGNVAGQLRQHCAGHRLMEYLGNKAAKKRLDLLRAGGGRLPPNTEKMIKAEEKHKLQSWLTPELRKGLWPVKEIKRRVFRIKAVARILHTAGGGYKRNALTQ